MPVYAQCKECGDEFPIENLDENGRCGDCDRMLKVLLQLSVDQAVDEATYAAEGRPDEDTAWGWEQARYNDHR